MSKTKEEILSKYPRRTHDGILGEVGHYNESDVHSAMGEYAAVMAVAFAEWKEKETEDIGYGYFHIKILQDSAYNYSELYQYWIEKVYNK